MNILSVSFESKCAEYCLSSPQCLSIPTMRRRLANKINNQDCCYKYITQYLITITLSIDIFNGDHHIEFQNQSDLSISKILPIILYQLIIQKEAGNIQNYSMNTNQITFAEFQYTMNIMTDKSSAMLRFENYVTNNLYSEYTDKYSNISQIAIMLESSINIHSSSQDTLILITSSNTSSDTINSDVITTDDIDYDILNEWYFILILLVIIIGSIICISILIKHYYSGCNYQAMDTVDSDCSVGGSNMKRTDVIGMSNINLRKMSIASYSDGHGPYDQSIALDERDRTSSYMTVADCDEDSLLNSNHEESDQELAYLAYDTKYDSAAQ